MENSERLDTLQSIQWQLPEEWAIRKENIKPTFAHIQQVVLATCKEPVVTESFKEMEQKLL